MGSDHSHSHSHGHSHDHGSDEEEFSTLSPMDARVRALETLLTERGLVDRAAGRGAGAAAAGAGAGAGAPLDAVVERYEQEVGPHNGAQVVARAWTDPDYRAWLLEDADEAIASLGHVGRQGEHMVVVENTPEQHNMVVCTLCSCYPWPVLGLPPVWYKSPAYRAKAVIDPRGVLADFGVTLPEGTRIKVWDSTAEVRYLVLPMRPEGTEGLTEERLAELVTRDSMIGTGLALRPEEVAP